MHGPELLKTYAQAGIQPKDGLLEAFNSVGMAAVLMQISKERLDLLETFNQYGLYLSKGNLSINADGEYKYAVADAAIDPAVSPVQEFKCLIDSLTNATNASPSNREYAEEWGILDALGELYRWTEARYPVLS
jgi:hypothetical protein